MKSDWRFAQKGVPRTDSFLAVEAKQTLSPVAARKPPQISLGVNPSHTAKGSGMGVFSELQKVKDFKSFVLELQILKDL